MEYWSMESLKKGTELRTKDIEVGGKKFKIREISAWHMQSIADSSAKMTERGTLTGMNLNKVMILTLKYGVVEPDFSKLEESTLKEILQTMSYQNVMKLVTEINNLSGLAGAAPAGIEKQLFRKEPK